jgi:hypothetical protein
MNCVYFYVLVHKTHSICDKKRFNFSFWWTDWKGRKKLLKGKIEKNCIFTQNRYSQKCNLKFFSATSFKFNQTQSLFECKILFIFTLIELSRFSVQWNTDIHLHRLFSVNRGAIMLKDSTSWLLKWDYVQNAYAQPQIGVNLIKCKIFDLASCIFDWHLVI